MKAKTWSLILEDAPRRGSLNMAIDERLFIKAREESRTFLRFYQWERPTASLGYSQDADKAVDLESCRKQGIDVVRRLTGGKLVLHYRELTYSLASSDVETFTATLRDSYQLISLALVKGLELMGLAARLAPAAPPAYARGLMPCFAYPARDEIEIGGRKIVGSAQKRTAGVFLQHGSVPLESDETLLKSIARSEIEGGEVSMTSLSEVLGRSVAFEWAASRFTMGISDFFGIKVEPYVFEEADRRAIARLEAERYGNDDWTFRERAKPALS